MDFSTTLPLIRDEVGAQPDDNTLEEHFDVLGHWRLVAIRVLKRRYAAATSGGQTASSFSLDGVLSVGLGKADLTQLSKQIERLEAQHLAESTGHPAGRGRVVREDR